MDPSRPVPEEDARLERRSEDCQVTTIPRELGDMRCESRRRICQQPAALAVSRDNIVIWSKCSHASSISCRSSTRRSFFCRSISVESHTDMHEVETRSDEVTRLVRGFLLLIEIERGNARISLRLSKNLSATIRVLFTPAFRRSVRNQTVAPSSLGASLSPVSIANYRFSIHAIAVAQSEKSHTSMSRTST